MKLTVPGMAKRIELVKKLPKRGIVIAKTSFIETFNRQDSFVIDGKRYSQTIDDKCKLLGYTQLKGMADDEFIAVYGYKLGLVQGLIPVGIACVIAIVSLFSHYHHKAPEPFHKAVQEVHIVKRDIYG